MRLNEMRDREYDGFSYEMASRRAQEVCKIAGETGQTNIAFVHLSAPMRQMARHTDHAWYHFGTQIKAAAVFAEGP